VRQPLPDYPTRLARCLVVVLVAGEERKAANTRRKMASGQPMAGFRQEEFACSRPERLDGVS